MSKKTIEMEMYIVYRNVAWVLISIDNYHLDSLCFLFIICGSNDH